MSASNRYLDQMSLFWKLNDSKQFTASEAQLFFYLLNVSCSMGVDVFERTDVKIAGDMGISVNTLKKARSGLIERRLIDVTLCVSGISKTIYRMNYQLDYQNSCQTDCQKLTATLTVETPDYQPDYQKLTDESSPAKEKNQKKNNTIQNSLFVDENSSKQETPKPKQPTKPKKTKEQVVAETEARRKEFYNSLIPYVERYGKEMVREFYDYWSELSPSGSKMKWEQQKTWELNRRLAYWERRGDEISSNRYGNNRSNNQSGAEQRMQEGAAIVARLLAEDDAKAAAGKP